MGSVKHALLGVAIALGVVSCAQAGTIFDTAGKLYGVDPMLLRSIAMRESSIYPWALNFGGQSLYLPSHRALVRTFKASRDRPYLVSVSYRGDRPARRLFFRTAAAAEQFRSNLGSDSSVRSVKVSRVNVDNVDVGLMQINWGWHGKEFSSIDQMSRVHANVMYASRLLSGLIQKHGIFRGVGYYHSSSDRLWQNYYRKVRRVYIKLAQGS